MLRNKVALITGSSRGIGREIAILFARNGASVVINYNRSEKEAKDLEEIIKREGGKAVAIKADVKVPIEVNSLFKAIKDEFGGLDILVNNAGIINDNLILMTSEEDWDRIIDTNLKGTFLCMQRAVKVMMRAGKGKIINISSIIGVQGNSGQVAYSASKAGIIGLTKSAAKELSQFGITVNAIAPGLIETDMTRELNANIKKRLIGGIGAGRMGRPEEVASVALFLASDLSSYVNGQVIGVDGCQVI
jgi:3-oxoacyl-[acyl-carrier protein] reductase